ncbi:MAG: 2-oxoglutarate dehydrogenase E1 component, partial [Fibrobacteria bacterium]
MGTIEPNNLSLGFVEALYADYLKDPASVAEDWRLYFQSLAGDAAGAEFRSNPQLGPTRNGAGLFQTASNRNGSDASHGAAGEHAIAALQDRADSMVRAYRVRGHLFARIDPLGLPPKGNVADLEPSYFGLKDSDLDRTVSGITISGPDVLTLRQVLERMNNTYCRSVGVQYMHIDSPEVRSWLASRMEGTENRVTLAREQQLDILTRLTDAVIFEEFIQKKYLGAKSFSLEGSESLIP